MSLQIQDVRNDQVVDRIIELQSALFFTETDSLIKLPTHIISEVEVDEEGQIWFVIPRPTQQIEAFGEDIATRMEFFKKGKDFFVKLTGKAILITEVDLAYGVPAAIQQKMTDKKLIAVKVEVKESSLVDNTPKPSRNWLQVSRSQLSSWFF